MRDGKGIEKWTEFELTRVNRGIVVRKKRLSVLLKEEKPECSTRDGEPHIFDHDVLVTMAAVLREGEGLDLPITIYMTTAGGDHSYVSDQVAADVLRRLENFSEAYPYSDGKMWLPNSLAYALLMKYTTAIQVLFF